MKKQAEPKYNVGDTVTSSMFDGKRKITDRTHNGYTWMYAFEGTDLRCGEQYLKPVTTVAQ